MAMTHTLSYRALSGYTRALAARPTLPAVASSSKLTTAAKPRYLSRSRVHAAAVSGGEASHIIDATRQANSSDGRTPLQVRRDQNASPQDRKSALDEARERKLRQYEKLLKAKAAAEGASSIEELAARKKAEQEAALGITPGSQGSETQTEKADMELAARIRQQAEAEAKRKLASGELTGGGDKGPIKPLSSIMDLSKLEGESAESIGKLWTGYHSIKKKLSAVIPTDTYVRLLEKAKRYPQFVLPLPRTIVGGEDGDQADNGLKAGEQKQGYQIQFMEWGFLPAPEAQGSGAPRLPSPATVLFTPLAEYKLRQEFAQPLLVLTHYTDLAHSKGVVLMRGEITSSEELEASPTAVAAAEAAKARGASEEEQKRLLAPVQSGGSSPGAQSGQGQKMSEQDAQLLAMTMQRFYLPANNKAAVSADGAEDAQAGEREQLLRSFHEDKDAFSVQRLCQVAFTF